MDTSFNFDETDSTYIEVLSLKKKNRKMNKKNEQLTISLIISRVIAIACFLFGVSALLISNKKVDQLTAQVNQYKSELNESTATLTAENKKLQSRYSTLYSNFSNLCEISVALDTNNQELLKAYKSNYDELSKLRKRSELYDKYEYAITDKSGTRTDITYDEITTLQELCKDKGMSDDVPNLILGIAMTESGGQETAKNPTSTATGLGGFLSSTGYTVYTKMMGNSSSSYSHETIAKDGETSLKMMAYYIDYLYSLHGNNVTAILRDYRGTSDPGYNSKINSYLATVGLSISDISIK